MPKRPSEGILDPLRSLSDLHKGFDAQSMPQVGRRLKKLLESSRIRLNTQNIPITC